MTIAPKEFVRDPFRKRRRPVKSIKALADFKRGHEFCQACGKPSEITIHHILGGRAGRSDEACNLLACCWEPCHREFADHTANLGVVLSMKLRAGELTQADLDRLQELNGKRLPDLAPIPAEYVESYERNTAMRNGVAA